MGTNEEQLPLFTSDPEAAYEISDSDIRTPPPDDPFSKYIVYVDESGDHSLQSIDPNYPIFVLAFCIFHKRHYSEAVVPALEKFKFNHFGHDQVVLHENEIRKEKGTFNIFRSRDQKIAFLDELGQIIERSNFILVSCTIDKRAFRKQAGADLNPYNIALAACMDALYDFLEEKQQHQKTTHIVVECRGRKEDIELELEFRRICDRNSALGKMMPFEILFSDKRVMSTGLQFADLVARPIGLNLLKPEQDNKAFEVLKNKFYCGGGRNKVGKDYKGVGMLFEPKSEKPR